MLKELQEKGVLDNLVIVGSWCLYYYKVLFDNAPEIPLFPNPSKFKTNMDVSELLNQLGFDSDFEYNTGLVKYVHPDLEIQFLPRHWGTLPTLKLSYSKKEFVPSLLCFRDSAAA